MNLEGFSACKAKSTTRLVNPLYKQAGFVFCYRDNVSQNRLFDPVGVEIGVEADNELILDPISRGAQVAAGPHHLLQERFFVGRDRFKALKLFPFGDRDRLGLLQQPPGFIRTNPGGTRINNLFRCNLFLLKKLLSIFTGRSPLAQVCPIDLHACLLCV